ncbi:MAG: mechanosensitive ion channel [Bacteroidia bacterium]|nr:mechanosensitive ion channel [Bacteroidia bacterium]
MAAKWSETTEKIGKLLKKTIISFGEEKIYVHNILVAILVIVAAFLIIRWIKRLLGAAQKANKLTIGQKYAYTQLSKYLIILLAIIIVLESLKVDITILLAGSAAFFLALALGLQHLFNDLVSGFFLLFEGTIRVGDIIEVDGMVSRVQEIGIRTSKVKNRDGISLVIPNSKIISNSVINWTTDSRITRFQVKVNVAYGSDVELVREVLLECAEKHSEIVRSPKPICRFTDFAESALEFELLFWSKNRFRIEDVKSDVRFMVNEAFNKKGIQIPFPQRDIHIKTNPDKVNLTGASKEV